MPAEAAAVHLLPRPERGRCFEGATTIRLADVDPGGLVRFDAIARLLQDIATDDAADAELDRRFGWLVRRTLVEIERPARLGEHVDIATWCTGVGRSWAERRTSIRGERGASIETVSLWVQIDVVAGRPAAIADDFIRAYGEASGGRKVSARLALPAPEGGENAQPWTVRRSDLDPFDHVNNAATWAFLEEVAEVGDRCGRAEMEYLLPLEYGAPLALHVAGDAPTTAWLVNGDRVHAAARWTPGNPST